MRRVLSATVVAAAVATAPIVSCSSSTGAALHTPGVANWTLCRASDVNAAGLSGHNVSVFGWTPSAALRSACIFTDRPSTALAALTTNGTFPDPFVDDNMASAIPDISVSTPSFYTYYFVVNANSNCSADAASTRLLLRLGQINYRASVFIDGAAIAPVGVGTPDAVGMFQRFLFSGDASVGAGPQGHGLAVLVMPADHPGNASNACKGCGQGGNHELALDVTSQYGGGWDWIGGTPDRQTGLFDTFTLSAVPSGVLMRDPIAVVTALGNVSDDGVAAVGLNATITVSVLRVPSTGPASQNVTGTLTLNITELGVMTVAISLPPTVNGTDARWVDVSFPSLVPESVDLWWPHNAGSPRLYDAVLTFLPDNAAWAPTVLNWRVGFRTVDSDIDSGLGGREFHVNGRRVFLQGGNFIASDQLNRHSTDASRQFADVKAHAEAGLNFMRLWGGSGGASSLLFEAADELGVLIMHEFWMSGDNNGRWAGSYSSPLDHELYLAAARDTVSRLRGHASLLFWCAGNELYPAGLSPPPDIAVGLATMVGATDSLFGVYDHDLDESHRVALTGLIDLSRRPFVLSSMTNYTVDNPFNPVLALAPSDGPYGVIHEATFWERNPGMHAGDGSHLDTPLAFQPEVGSSSTPEYESLARFMSPGVLAQTPLENCSYAAAPPVWRAHNFLPYVDNEGVDHIYAYGGTINTSTAEYAMRAQLAQVRQYQALLEGYASAMWVWYSAVTIWKTNTPWPALRGVMYDPYLAPTGTFWGVKAATGGSGPRGRVRIQLNQANATVTVYTRGALPVDGPLTAVVQAYDIATGKAMFSPPIAQVISGLAPGVPPIQLPAVIPWPSSATSGAVLLFRLSLEGDDVELASSEYWLAGWQGKQDYAALGALRTSGRVIPVHGIAVGSLRNNSAASGVRTIGPATSVVVNITLSTPPDAGAVAFGVTAVLRRVGSTVISTGPSSLPALSAENDLRVLPQYASTSYFSIVPGEGVQLTIEAPWVDQLQPMVVRVSGWNGGAVDLPVNFTAAAVRVVH